MKKVVSFAVLALILWAGTSAAAQPQLRPQTPEPFLGKFSGAWEDLNGQKGEVTEVTAEQKADGTVQMTATLTNAVVPGFGMVAKFVDGELIVERPTLTMTFRLYTGDRIEAAYHNRTTGARGSWKLARKTNGMASIPTSPESLIKRRLVEKGTWKGEFGSRPSGTFEVSFNESNGTLTGELTKISGISTAYPGPLTDLEVKGDELRFSTPGTGALNKLKLQKDGTFDGGWYGRSSGWLKMSPK